LPHATQHELMNARARKENERLRKLKGGHTSTLAKRYKLPERAMEIIKQAGKIHGQQSRAIQIAVEIIYRTPEKDYTAPATITGTPLTGKTYGLPARTIKLIAVLALRFGTRGNVLAACKYLLAEDLKTAEKWGEPRSVKLPAAPKEHE